LHAPAQPIRGLNLTIYDSGGLDTAWAAKWSDLRVCQQRGPIYQAIGQALGREQILATSIVVRCQVPHVADRLWLIVDVDCVCDLFERPQDGNWDGARLERKTPATREPGGRRLTCGGGGI
jgi:hypothetical protein